MSSSGLAQVGVGTPAPAAIADAFTNPSTVDVAALQLAYNGASWDRARVPSIVRGNGATVAGNTVLWTPAAGKKFRLMRFWLYAPGDVTIGVAGRNVLQLLDGAASMNILIDPWMPAASLNNGGLLFSTGWVDLGHGILSSTANNVLNLNMGTTPTNGAVRAIVVGTEE